MDIYFAGSIKGGRENQEFFEIIIKLLSKHGNILTEHVAEPGLTQQGETNITQNEIIERDIKLIDSCDLVVAEVTTPSLGVGYEIGRAEMLGKKIVCLYQCDDEHKISAMIMGNKSIIKKKYNKEDLEEVINSIV